MTDVRVAQLLSAAAAETRAQRPDQAARLLEQVLALAPDHPQALNALGTRALASHNPGRARDLFQRAAAADPREPVLWLNVARACRELGDDDGELAALDRILDLDARHFMALFRKAHLEQRQGKDAAAALRWTQAQAVAPPLDQLNPELQGILEQGLAFAARHQAAFAAQLDAELGPHRHAMSRSDTRRFDAAVDAMLGRRRIYANECAGLHFPFLPADEFFDEAHFPWFADLDAATPAIRAELQDLLATGDDGFAPYVQYPPGYPESKWSQLDHSERWSAYFLWRHGSRIDAHCKRCPTTAAALEKVPLADHHGHAPTVFFSLLHPKTRIPPHTGVTNTRAIVHLPLIVPGGCGFRVGGETRAWVEGKAFAFDDTIEHEAWNESDQLRAVLILDVWNPHIAPHERALINRMFEVSAASGMTPAVEG